MKKPKIKPEVVWMPWHTKWQMWALKCIGVDKRSAIKSLTDCMHESWIDLVKQGWRIVKVEVREKK